LIDVGAGYGIFLDEWRVKNSKTELIAVEPSSALATECRNKDLNVIELTAEDVEGYDDYADLVVCFEVLEHVDDPLNFVTALKKMVRPGGYLFVSTLSIDGFDLKTLWDKSSQISPPHHINFHSIKGFELLFNRASLDEIKITTPGKLDVDIVKNFINNNQSAIQNNRFLQTLLNDTHISENFQNFLSENRLSSHAWVLGRKPLG
jgi:2-polyprenyl-3-methyl-5-hydroxy-6-metoxy-1,4-benzoquinol methylase